jgi:hypothetical protein
VKHMNFNQLTPGEAERLAMLSEEAGEVIEMVSIVLAEGMTARRNGQANRVALEAECAELLAIAGLMQDDLGELPEVQTQTYLRNATTTGYAGALNERLGALGAAAGRLVQMVGKTLRHGYSSSHPNYPDGDNRFYLAREVARFMAVLDGIESGFFPGKAQLPGDIITRKLRYTHHQTNEATA